MRIRDSLKAAIEQLKNSSTDSAQLDAELLLLHAINNSHARPQDSRAWLQAHLDDKLTDEIIRKFESYVSERATGKPVAYITKHKEFYGLDFHVDERVLVPRPETELLVELALQNLDLQTKKQQYHKISRPRKNANPLVIDVGTGSGCIIISLAKNLQLTTYNLQLYATDISAAALEVAELNAKRHDVNKQITFLQGNLLKPIIHNFNNGTMEQWNNIIITANLPYLRPEEANPSIAHEPGVALYTNEAGLKLILELLQQVKQLLKLLPVSGYQLVVIMEHSPTQAEQIRQAALELLPKAKVDTKKDLQGLDRVTLLRL